MFKLNIKYQIGSSKPSRNYVNSCKIFVQVSKSGIFIQLQKCRVRHKTKYDSSTKKTVISKMTCWFPAILHNNAMYLAHQLMFLGPRHRELMPPCLEGYTATFVDLIDSLRTLASSVLTNHLQAQKKQIIDTLRDSGKFYIVSCSLKFF